ncbi:MAG: hypothetical protein BGO01_07490 [Armatimonadetes bacterium 55-13]|nr:MAG: hypothetical protein BGO01_07490 [Armatimonadetes bacterium 55-13]
MRVIFALMLAIVTSSSFAQFDGMSPESRIKKDGLALIALIRNSFKGVKRVNGVSWSESVVLDDYGTMEERLAARSKDKEKDWTSLVEDRLWNPATGVGGWSFLDAIGFRYYLPAEMIRSVRRGYSDSLAFHLTLQKGEMKNYCLEQWARLDASQRACVKKFVIYMMKVSDDFSRKEWEEAFGSYWSSQKTSK